MSLFLVLEVVGECLLIYGVEVPECTGEKRVRGYSSDIFHKYTFLGTFLSFSFTESDRVVRFSAVLECQWFF